MLLVLIGSMNKIVCIDDSIGKASCLKYLNISFNPLRSISNEICRCEALEAFVMRSYKGCNVFGVVGLILETGDFTWGYS